MEINNFYGHSPPFKLAKDRVFSQHFGNMTRPLELGIFASFYTKLGKTHPIIKTKNCQILGQRAHIFYNNSPPLLHCSTTSCIYVHILMT